MDTNILLGIDANSIVHRAYHALPLSLTTSEGKPINAAYGFTSMLLNTLIKYQPEYVFCAFDLHGPTFRHKEYAAYKANRPTSDAELISQFDIIYQIVKSLNIPILTYQGYEADDILGTVKNLFKERHFNKEVEKYIILTGDRDLFQLVNDNVFVLIPKGSFKNLVLIDKNKVKEIFGVNPKQVVDLKALIGDSSDNIPGVRGIGLKTATKLLDKYSSLEQIYKHLQEIKDTSKRTATLLENGKNTAFLSQKLARISTDVPIIFNLSSALLKDFDLNKTMKLFHELQFKSLIPKLKELYAKLNPDNTLQIAFPTSHSEMLDLKIVDECLPPLKIAGLIQSSLNIDKLNQALRESSKSTVKIYSIDSLLQRKSLNDFVINMTTNYLLYYSIESKRVYIFDIQNLKLKIKGNPYFITINLWHLWQDLFAVAQEQKLLEEQLTVFFRSQLFAMLQNSLDLQLLAYLLSTGRKDYNVKSLINDYLKIPIDTLDESNPNQLLELFINLTLAELHHLLDIYKHGKDPLKLVVYADAPTAFAISMMKYNGITLNLKQVKEFSRQLKESLAQLEQDIYKTVGFEFNIRSTKQLASVLFEVLKLPIKKKTKTGFSTNTTVLQQLKGAHPVIDLILKYRQTYKIYSTYIKPFLNINSQRSTNYIKTGESTLRIHSDFNIMATTSGRISSSNPNLQNLPIRTELGRHIRKFFVADENKILISFDYSQIDLRVMAHLSQDKHLVSDFIKGLDVHRATAAKIFKKDYNQITKKERRIAKTINFGLIYGMSAFGLAKTLNISKQEATEFINAYFEEYQGVKIYREKTIEFVKKHHFVLSLLGRRRYIYGILSNNPMVRQAAIREAVNMPIQGGSDDIMRNALAKLIKLPEILNFDVKIVLQIHDEFVFEVPDLPQYRKEWPLKIKDLMEHALQLSVPLKVEYNIGKTLDKS